jgi:protein-tyrosine phosphatase
MELKSNNIKHIISIIGKEEILKIDDYFKHYIFYANDDFDTSILPICEVVHEILKNTDENVLVHCGAGISRSVTAVIYHMMQLDKSLTPIKALFYIQQSRDIACPNNSFMEQLYSLERV